VDHVMIGDGHPGKVTALLQKEFGTLVNKIPHS